MSRGQVKRWIFKKHDADVGKCECGGKLKPYYLATVGEKFMKPLWLCERDACPNGVPKTAEILHAEVKERH